MVNSIKNELLQQKKMQMKGNLYHYTQVNFAYNSNKMEGSRLSSDQTEMIFLLSENIFLLIIMIKNNGDKQ